MTNGPDVVIGHVNLGNPNECTILQLAEVISTLTDSKSEIIKKPLPKDDPIRRRPDITLAKQKPSWEPPVSWEEGLTKTIEWFRSINLAAFRAPTPNYE